MKHILTVATTYYKSIEVEAGSKDEAQEIAFEQVMSEHFDPIKGAEGEFDIHYDHEIKENENA